MLTSDRTSPPSPGPTLRAPEGFGSPPPELIAAVAFWALEIVLALSGVAFAPLAAAALVVAPGLALIPLLPGTIRAHRLPALAAAPALGYAASATLLIGAARFGLDLGDVTIRLLTGLLIVIGAVLWLRRPAPVAIGTPPLEALGLLLALIAGGILGGRVISGDPPPGLDWGHYLLYADEVRRNGSLLIDNPFWLLGGPFRDDPGIPAVYGGFLQMTDLPASSLLHGLWFFSLVAIGSVYAWVRAEWGGPAAVIAAALWATVPFNQDILGWHGLANVTAFALMPLLLAAVSVAWRRRLTLPEIAGTAVLGLGLVLSHRLSFVMLVLAVVLVVLASLARPPRTRMLVNGGLVVAAAVVLGAGAILDLLDRQSASGGTPDYRDYLGTKVDWELVVRDLTVPFAIAGVLALVAVALKRTRRSATLPALALLVVAAALSYGYVFKFPLVYVRMPYYLPLVLAPLVAGALVALLPRRFAVGAGLALAAVMAALALPLGSDVRSFYSFVTPSALKGLDALSQRLEPGQVVATDRCWSFIATWLLRSPTIAALDPADIQFGAEEPRARQARAIIEGGPKGRALARKLNVRYLLADPSCFDTKGRPVGAPDQFGRPLFYSSRLAIFVVRFP